MPPRFVLLAILLLAFSAPSGAQTSLPSEDSRVVERRANGVGQQDDTLPQYLQPLGSGQVRLGSRNYPVLSVHDLAADGTQLRSLRLNFSGLAGIESDFAPDGAGGTFAFGQTMQGCRIVRINADGNVLFQREVVMPSRAAERRGGALCQGFAVLADGTSVIGEFDSPVVLVSPDGATKVQAELAVPLGVNAFIGGMASNGRDVVLWGSADAPAMSGGRFWLGGFSRNGTLRWQHTFDLPEPIKTARLVADGAQIVAAVKSELLGSTVALYRFLAVDGDGVPVLAPTEPFVQPSESGFIKVLAREGRVAALIGRAGGAQLAARWPDGSQRLLTADQVFDFGPNGTFWLGAQSDCDGADANCQGHLEQLDAQGQMLRSVTLPDAFEVSGVLVQGARLVAGGRDRRLDSLGVIRHGGTYAAQVVGSKVSEVNLLREGRADHLIALSAGDSAYLWVSETSRSTLARYDRHGQARWEREVGRDQFLIAANQHGAWLLSRNEGSVDLRHASHAGELGPVTSHMQPFNYSQLQAQVANDGSLWLLLEPVHSTDVLAQLLNVSTDGALLSSRDLNISPRPAGFELALLDGTGDTLMRSNSALQRFDAAGRLLHSSPGVASRARHSMTTNRALLLHSNGTAAGSVQRIERNGRQSWNVPAPQAGFPNRCSWWDDATGSTTRLFVVFHCAAGFPIALQVERWNIETGALIRRTNMPLGWQQSGALTYTETPQRDTAGELLIRTTFLPDDTTALLRFQADQPATLLRLPWRNTSAIPHSRVTSAGDVLTLGATLPAIGDVEIFSSSSGLHGNGFE